MRPAGMTTAAGALLLALVLAVAGCGANAAGGASEPAPQWVGQLSVVNRSASDMDIFVVGRAGRLRIGLAPNNTTTVFKISPAQVAGTDMVRFVAFPLIGGGEVASTEPVHVDPTDVIELDIPPP